MQNKLLKLILKLDIQTRTNTVHKMLNILKIEDIHKTKVLVLWILVSWTSILQYLNSIIISKTFSTIPGKLGIKMYHLAGQDMGIYH